MKSTKIFFDCIELLILTLGSLRSIPREEQFARQRWDPIVGTSDNTGASGNVTLDFPTTLTGTTSLPFIFFEVYPQGSSFKQSIITNQSEVTKLKDDLEELDAKLNIEKESHVSKSVKIYPNPTENIVNLEVESFYEDVFDWVLTDVNGRVLKTGVIVSVISEIDIKIYESGVYFLDIKGALYHHREKIVKQ